MYYFFSLFLSNFRGGVRLFSWRLFCGSNNLLEEKEHLLLAFLGGLMLLLVFPVLEGGIKKWIFLAIFVISGFFCLRSPFWVYVFLELSLIPVLVLVIGWGIQPERVAARYHLLVYTFVFSCPLFVRILVLERGAPWGRLLWGFFAGLAFIVKTPIYFVHVWLPKAHVEAPTAGSIILAGILLKMGGIGLIWIQNFCGSPWSLLLFYCVLLGRAAAAIIRSFQRDGKAFVAYRRVAHINLRMLVVIFLRAPGDRRSSLLMLNHGLVRRRLFLLVGACFHLLNSRLVYLFSSIFLLKRRRFFVIAWIIACNFSVPPSLSFLGEVRALSLSLSLMWRILFIFCLYFLFVAYYSLFLNLSLANTSAQAFETLRRFIVWRLAGLRLADFCFWGLY